MWAAPRYGGRRSIGGAAWSTTGYGDRRVVDAAESLRLTGGCPTACSGIILNLSIKAVARRDCSARRACDGGFPYCNIVAMNRTLVLVLMLLILVSAVHMAGAQTGLYSAAAPEDAALVRVLHAAVDRPALEMDVGASSFGPIAYAQVTPYRPVSEDIYLLRAAGIEQTFLPRAGSYYTIVFSGQTFQILLDPKHTDPARAQIFLYNLSALSEVTLMDSEGRLEVIAAVPPGSAGQVSVNPVRIEFALFSRGEPIHQLGELGLRRGESYSVFVVGRAAAPTVFTTQAEVDVER